MAPKKKGGANVASLTLSLRSAAASVEGAFERARRVAARRPTMAAFAERRARARSERERDTVSGARSNAGPFASLSLSLPFGRGA